ncbi:MAG: hypothetical protein K0R65_10 [Crocinitomicaceae bacterium]|jgi:hypothetical protein|nr:hypothetical protein [Crocinitomicaceae bacterium]
MVIMGMFQKNKNYNPYLQVYAMKAHFPQFKHKDLRNGSIMFTGKLQVKPEFPVYTVSIEYRGNKRPKAKIIRPKLVVNPPHFYHQDDTLCLYHKKNYYWQKENSLALDIVPWVAGWIYFYEIWLQTGKWYGPEVKHESKKVFH